VDTALNNFVALHYKAKHMNWLHSFWGVGATLGPYIMGYVLLQGFSWNQGYLTISILQAILFGILLFTLPIWKKAQQQSTEEAQVHHTLKLSKLFQMKGAKMALLGFFAYCALEATTGLWGATFLVKEKGIVPETAVSWIAFFYLGITLGRFMSGFASAKLSNQKLIRLGQGMVLVGIVLFFFTLPSIFLVVSFFLIGIGCAPIYPSMLHETPNNFWQRSITVDYGHPDGSRLCGNHLHAAFVWSWLPIRVHWDSTLIFWFFFCIFLILMTEGLHRKLKEKKY
jgi:fucose permease